MQRERADRQIEPAQAQRGQAEHDTEQRADQRRRRQRDPERRLHLLEQDADREGAGRQQPGMTERDLAGVAGQQHQRERADRRPGKPGWRDRAGRARPGTETPGARPASATTRAALGARLDQPEILRVAGAEIAAGARPPRHGRVPRACRTGPRAARPAWRSAPGTARPPTAADRRSGSAAPRPRPRSASRRGRRRGCRARRPAPPGNALRPMMAMVWPRPESSAISMPASAPVRVESAPGQRVDGVQVDAALRCQQRVLAGRAHAHAPAAEAQEQRAARRRRAPSSAPAAPHRARCAHRPAARSAKLAMPQRAAPDTAAAPTRPARSTPRSRMPSATVVSTAASTISPVILRIRNR